MFSLPCAEENFNIFFGVRLSLNCCCSKVEYTASFSSNAGISGFSSFVVPNGLKRLELERFGIKRSEYLSPWVEWSFLGVPCIYIPLLVLLFAGSGLWAYCLSWWALRDSILLINVYCGFGSSD